MFYQRTFTFLALVGMGLTPATVFAENGAEKGVHSNRESDSGSGYIEELVVTSEFRSQSVGDTPGSISVLKLDNLRGRALNHLEDVLAQVPNVNFASGASRARFIQIRGIGERGQFDEPMNSSVGLLIDGVDFSGIGTAAVLHDVSQIEVLRGPQGTLYGANALAGLIQVRTNEPTETFQGNVSLDAGNYGARGVGFFVSGPLTGQLGGRLAVRKYQDDGYITNEYLDSRDTDNHDELSVRGKLAWTPREDLDIGLSLGYIDIDNGYDAFSLDNTRETLSDETGFDIQESAYAGLNVGWDVTDVVSFDGSLGHARSEIDYGYDEDWTYVGFHPFGYSSTDNYQRERTTTTLDLRLMSGSSGRIFNGTTDWLVGVFGLTQNVDLTRRYTFLPEDFTSEFGIDRVALYGELTFPVVDNFRLTLGLRAEHHESKYADPGFAVNPEDDLLGGRLVLEWDLADGSLAYFSATRGYKAGGFNTSGSLDDSMREFDPETLWNFEVGLKGRWFDDRLDGRFSLFTMRRDDVQVDTSITVPRPDGSSGFIQLKDNAASGSNSGVEMELTLAVTRGLQLFANVGLLRSEFEDFINSSGEDLDGEEQAHAPGYQFFLGGEYRFAGGWFARVELEGRDEFYYSDSRRFAPNAGDLKSERYELLNASIGYEARRWSVRAWGRNLTDEDYYVRGFYFPNDPRDGYTERGFFQFGDPRLYGLTLNLNI